MINFIKCASVPHKFKDDFWRIVESLKHLKCLSKDKFISLDFTFRTFFCS